MPWKEWSLIVNSLLIQLAVGMMTFLSVYRLISGGDRAAMAITERGLVLIGPMILAGMLVSLFHLGHPLRAYRATSNLRTSWLSREVLFTGAFFVFWLGCYFLEITGSSSVLLTWAAVTAGLLSVLSMTGIYSTTSIKGWRGMSTYIAFFGTVIIFGSVGSAVIIVNAGQEWVSLRGGIIASILGALLILVIRFVHQLRGIRAPEATHEKRNLDRLVAADSVRAKCQNVALYKKLTLWAGAMLLTSVALSLYILVTKRGHASIPAFPILGFALIGELLGRVGFYSLWHEPDQIQANHGSNRDEYGRYLRI